MKTSLSIGTTPANEHCPQLGAENYALRARTEGQAFLAQIRRVVDAAHEAGTLGEEPWTRLQDGRVRLCIVPCAHDFGTYYDGEVRFERDDEAACALASFIDSNLPGQWDKAALAYIHAEQERLGFVTNKGGWSRP